MRLAAPIALSMVGLVLGTSSMSAAPRAVASAGSCPTGKPPPLTITTIQAIQFDLMRRSSFNNFDGPRVARDLLRHRRLWCGAILDRLGDDALIKLRDIDENYWNVDTLYVLSSEANDAALLRLAHHWQADAIQWVGAPPPATNWG